MNRRDFLKRTAAALVAASVPGLVAARTLDEAEALGTRTFFHGGWQGERDDSVWIQAALDKAARDGSTVVLRQGDYQLKHGIRVPTVAKGHTILDMQDSRLIFTASQPDFIMLRLPLMPDGWTPDDPLPWRIYRNHFKNDGHRPGSVGIWMPAPEPLLEAA